MKKPASKVAKPAQIQPKSQFLFHKNLPPRDLSIMTLRASVLATKDWRRRDISDDDARLLCYALTHHGSMLSLNFHYFRITNWFPMKTYVLQSFRRKSGFFFHIFCSKNSALFISKQCVQNSLASAKRYRFY